MIRVGDVFGLTLPFERAAEEHPAMDERRGGPPHLRSR
jgi:hypothetical protein